MTPAREPAMNRRRSRPRRGEQNFRPKVGCGCVSNQLPGFVVLDGAGHVNCGLPQFKPDGSLLGVFLCNGDFIVLR